MAGEWLKFECSLPEKPETMAITVAMGWDDTDLTVGKLMRLFRWFDQQTLDGNAPGVTAALLDKLIGVTGFVQAVIGVGWLTVTANGLALKNFERHNGLTAKSRAQTAKRVANFRSKDAPDPILNAGNGASVTEALAREEKKREEKKEDSEAKASGGKPPKVTDPDEIIFGYGLPMLMAAGNVEKHARSFLGGLRKTHGDAPLIDALRECITAKPLQPLEWLAKALPPKGGKAGKHRGFQNVDYTEGVTNGTPDA